MSEPACFVDIACNNPNNGNFAGSAGAFTFECAGSEVSVAGDVFDGIEVAFDGCWALLIGGVSYTFLSQRKWVGNWCWDRFQIPLDEARRLLEQLFRAGFDLDSWDDGTAFAELIRRKEAGEFDPPKEARPA